MAFVGAQSPSPQGKLAPRRISRPGIRVVPFYHQGPRACQVPEFVKWSLGKCSSA
jgi:hypothetical protein